MTDIYARAYTEVVGILNCLSEEEYDKIPKEKIAFYKENMDKDYKYSINPKIDLSKQNISKEANAILISIFRDYFATEIQKKTLQKLLNENQEKLETEKRKKYNQDDIFKKKSNNEDILIVNNISSKYALIKVKKHNIFQKIIDNIRNFIREI